MTEWNTMETEPQGVFDALARGYDPGLNRFILYRFTGCIIHEFSIVWGSPFPGDETRVDLQKSGFRIVAWKPSPGPEDIPSWLEKFPQGPADRITE